MLINLMEFLSSSKYNKKIHDFLDIKKLFVEGQAFTVKDKVEVDLELISVSDKKVMIKGMFNLDVIIPCSRCLENVVYTISEDIVKDFNFDFNSRIEEDEDFEEEVYLQENTLDVEQLIRHEALIHFPLKVLCRKTCAGICRNCGANLNTSKCECDKTDIDPRMAVFQDILKGL